jgi:hypothetical protein
LEKSVFIVPTVLALTFGVGVPTKADSIKHDDKSVRDVDFGEHGNHFGWSNKEKACGSIRSDQRSDALAVDSDKDDAKHKEKDKNKGACKEINSRNDEFADLDSTPHLVKVTSLGNNPAPAASTSPVLTPEPASFLLLCFGLANVTFLRRKRDKRC